MNEKPKGVFFCQIIFHRDPYTTGTIGLARRTYCPKILTTLIIDCHIS
ncbi:hypothetical protein EV681_4057 [Advenella incenata]|uniref:Uncharacterized protein n=1 Tax=Advenella incenata TaxID=267800 RepID=A0A4Q7VBR1_9BURK|nr:hypothetical protein EV681_4057 [Advenella incenata]